MCHFYSWVLFLNIDQLSRLAGSTFHSAVYLSNFYFWAESGYFDADSIQKPLLHTWSLSVEEQFYLFWPLTLALFSKFMNSVKGVVCIIAIALMSFALNLLFSASSSALFFLFPFRVFEFSIGAMLV